MAKKAEQAQKGRYQKYYKYLKRRHDRRIEKIRWGTLALPLSERGKS